MDAEKMAAALDAQADKTMAERYWKERNEALRVLYYTYKRRPRSKWATAEVYAIRDGRLEHLTTVRFQPGASRGLRAELVDASGLSAWLDDLSEVQVMEIEPRL